MAVGIYDWALLRNVATGHWQLAHWGDEAGLARRLDWLMAQRERTTLPLRLTGPWQSNMTRAEYGDKFARIQAYLAAGDCYQINLTQRFSAPYQGDEWSAYLALSAANKAPFSAFVRLPHSAILSLSPERFLLLDKRHIETKPIKGTRPRHPIHGELDARWQEVDLLRACFPGGSITGAPKIRAMEIIEELEPVRRNAYCGSIGYLSQHGRMDTSICIRTLIAEAGQLHCWAGGGIIADSDPDAEYQETYDKVARILPLLDAL